MFYQRCLDRIPWEPRRRSNTAWKELGWALSRIKEATQVLNELKLRDEKDISGEKNTVCRGSKAQNNTMCSWDTKQRDLNMASGASQGVASTRAGKAGSNRVMKCLMCQANKFRLCHVSKIPSSQSTCWEVGISPLTSNPLPCRSSFYWLPDSR